MPSIPDDELELCYPDELELCYPAEEPARDPVSALLTMTINSAETTLT